ncbi:MAG: hypothetical protein IIB82_13850 [Bacteroidetes bacterium]|nr:hypothetical protein [Bacteroidota bacterium]
MEKKAVRIIVWNADKMHELIEALRDQGHYPANVETYTFEISKNSYPGAEQLMEQMGISHQVEENIQSHTPTPRQAANRPLSSPDRFEEVKIDRKKDR